jgi:hypothetical protein
MLSIDTPIWQLRYIGGTLSVTQRASRAIRTCYGRSYLPSDEALALMSEYRFNALCREIFHNTGNK